MQVLVAERLVMFVVGLVFVLGGGFIAKGSLDARNMVETALFGLFGLATGLFLLISSVAGPPPS